MKKDDFFNDMIYPYLLSSFIGVPFASLIGLGFYYLIMWIGIVLNL